MLQCTPGTIWQRGSGKRQSQASTQSDGQQINRNHVLLRETARIMPQVSEAAIHQNRTQEFLGNKTRLGPILEAQVSAKPCQL